MLPPKPHKSVEIGVRRDHCASVFHRNGCVLNVRDQLSRCSCLAAQALENGQVIGPRTDDSRCRSLYERCHEGKAVSRVAAESKIREFVALRMKPDKTRTEKRMARVTLPIG